jgi:hypothetical protein
VAVNPVDQDRIWQGLNAHLDDLGRLAPTSAVADLLSGRHSRPARRVRLASVLAALGLVVVLGWVLVAPRTLPPATIGHESSGPTVASPAAVSSTALYELAPPPSVTAWLGANVDVGFRRLTEAELSSVTVTADQARARALAEPGFGYGPGSSTIDWTSVGCLYLGYYRGMHQPSIGYVPPEYPAYLVQVLGAPAEGFPNLNIALTIVDARTGEHGPTIGFGDGPILGTTCGART